MVGATARKDARKTKSAGYAHSVAPAGGMPPPAGAGRWKVLHGPGNWVEQTVEVELVDAAQLREWAARQAQQVGASTAAAGPPALFCPRFVLALVFPLLTVLATCCGLLRRPQVEAAWAAAAQVVISGAAGPRAAEVNGRFEQVEREVYQKVGEPDRWLFVDCKGL